MFSLAFAIWFFSVASFINILHKNFSFYFITFHAVYLLSINSLCQQWISMHFALLLLQQNVQFHRFKWFLFFFVDVFNCFIYSWQFSFPQFYGRKTNRVLRPSVMLLKMLYISFYRAFILHFIDFLKNRIICI